MAHVKYMSINKSLGLQELAKDCLRIEKLRVFGEYLCGVEPPMLAYNVETRQYYSVAPSQGYDEKEAEEEEEGCVSEVQCTKTSLLHCCWDLA